MVSGESIDQHCLTVAGLKTIFATIHTSYTHQINMIIFVCPTNHHLCGSTVHPGAETKIANSIISGMRAMALLLCGLISLFMYLKCSLFPLVLDFALGSVSLKVNLNFVGPKG